MIEPMTAVAVAMPAKQRGDGLARLGALGVLHLRHRRPPAEDDRESRQVANALRILDTLEESPGAALAGGISPGEESIRALASRIERLDEEHERLEEAIAETTAEIERLAPLGDFEPALLDDLMAKGVVLRVFRGTARLLAQFPSGHPHRVVAETGSTVLVTTTAEPGDLPPEWVPFPLPSESPAQLDDQLRRLGQQRERVVATLHQLKDRREELAAEAERLACRRDWRSALGAMRSLAPIVWIEGYCPARDLPLLEKACSEENWALAQRPLTENDDPPTLLRHRPWVRPLQPVYDLIGSLPGYREFDASPWFLAYLTLFFGILIGDAGYGLLLIATAALIMLVQRRAASPERSHALPALLAILGGSTTIWGALSGNWFGIEPWADAPVLRHLIIPAFDAWTTESQQPVIALCFLIGATHLSAGHLIVAWRERRSLTCLAQAGWVLIVWATWFVAGYLVLGNAISPLTLPLLGTGMALVVLFTSTKKNPAIRLGIGLGELPLKLMNGFADLISYIRLFAVGMATLAVAASFNEIALGAAASGGILAILLATVVLLFGHGINLIMAALSVMVHGVRLNLMEFSNHAGLQWSGIAYEPLRVTPAPPPSGTRGENPGASSLLSETTHKTP